MPLFKTRIWSVGLLLSTFSLCIFFFILFIFFPLCLKKLSPNSALLCLWLSEKTERLNSTTRPLICDWVWEMREPSVATRRELSARFGPLQRPTAGLRPQKHTRQWPPGAAAVDTDVERNSTDATHSFWDLNPLFVSLLAITTHTHTHGTWS